MEKTARENFKSIVAAYRKTTKRSEAAISKELYGNASFLEEFFAGRATVSLRKFTEMLDHLRANWPEGADWPYCPAIFFRPPQKKRKLSPAKRAAA